MINCVLVRQSGGESGLIQHKDLVKRLEVFCTMLGTEYKLPTSEADGYKAS